MTTPRRSHTPEFLAEIARQHNAHVKAGWPPLRAIAVANGITPQSAARWVRECRTRGFDIKPADGLQHHYPWRGEQR